MSEYENGSAVVSAGDTGPFASEGEDLVGDDTRGNLVGDEAGGDRVGNETLVARGYGF